MITKKIPQIVLIGILFLSVFFVTRSASLSPQVIASPGTPIRLIVPKVNIDAHIEHVGLTKGGAMDTPKETNNVGWFMFGSRPGEIGTATIAGHSGWKNNTPVVFDSLSDLQLGDLVYVENSEKIISTFIVRDIKIYDENADTTSVFTSSDGISHLNLITCDGTWNKENKSYSDRLVVFTDKLPSTDTK